MSVADGHGGDFGGDGTFGSMIKDPSFSMISVSNRYRFEKSRMPLIQLFKNVATRIIHTNRFIHSLYNKISDQSISFSISNDQSFFPNQENVGHWYTQR